MRVGLDRYSRLPGMRGRGYIRIVIGDIRQQLEVAPFEPFTIVTSSGGRYSVPTADHVGLNPRGRRAVVWFDDDSSVIVAELHIAAIEKGISAGGNGGTSAGADSEAADAP